jgi:hypothetical protein
MGLPRIFEMPPLGERLAKEHAFFANPFAMSYSGLNKLLFSPALFYRHYVLGQREDNIDKNMLEGRLIHCLLLAPHTFDDEFIIAVANMPSDNPREIIHKMFTLAQIDPRSGLEEYATEILEELATINLYQSYKTDKQRLDKIINPEGLDYWEYMFKAKGRTVIDFPMFDFAKEVVSTIESKRNIMELMGFNQVPGNGVSSQNELELIKYDEDFPFALRGFVDNLVIDEKAKEIRINDLKKSGKALDSFVDSIDYFRYWMQAAMYHMLVENTFLSQAKYADFKIVFRFIVVDTYMQIAPIKVSDETMIRWLADAKEKIAHGAYHFTSKDFSLPYIFLIHDEMTL